MIYIYPDRLVKNRLDNLFPRWHSAVLCFRGRKSFHELVKAFSAEPVGYNVLYGQEQFTESPFVYEATIGTRENRYYLLPAAFGAVHKSRF